MKKLIKQIFQKLGYELQRTNLYTRVDLRLLKFLELHKIDTVLDVGANKGQFALELLKSGYKGRIVSFEALPSVYDELKRNAQKYGSRWLIAPCCALSDEEGQIQSHVTNNLASSSMLIPSEILTNASERFASEETIEVKCAPLDDVLDQLDVEIGNLFLKIDVQGAEQKVLAGATKLMPSVDGVLHEMSLRTLYDEQPLARELDTYLIDQGFDLWDINTAYRDVKTARLDQYDGIYFRI